MFQQISPQNLNSSQQLNISETQITQSSLDPFGEGRCYNNTLEQSISILDPETCGHQNRKLSCFL